MLILTRKIGQSIRIDDSIVITVVELRGGNIRLGIDAPRQVKVYREEIFQRIKEANEVAAASVPKDVTALDRIWRKAVASKPLPSK